MAIQVVEKWGALHWLGAPRQSGRSKGIPPGGAFDQRSLAIANVLVGNPPHAHALEFAGDRLTLLAETDTTIAVVGANVNDDRFPGRIGLPARESLVLTLADSGLRIVIALLGGHRTGPAEVKVKDVISTMTTTLGPNFRLAEPLDWINQPEIRYVPDAEAGDVVSLTLTRHVNRQGLRLQGDVHGWPGLEFSEPSALGLIQVTPDGTVLIHGPDGPTIGGYGRLGTVIQADIPALAQWKPGDSVQLTPVSVDHAHRVQRDANENLAHQLRQLRLATGLMT